jgi:hypothetical protein
VDGRSSPGHDLPEVGLTTQLGFGRGSDAATLYLTTAAPSGLYRITTTKKGHYFD